MRLLYFNIAVRRFEVNFFYIFVDVNGLKASIINGRIFYKTVYNSQ